MSVLRAVLDYEVPLEWVVLSESDYSTSYKLFEIDDHTNEWYNAISDFGNLRHSTNSIQRIQNPFQLGLFKIQELKRKEEGFYVGPPKIGYHIIHPDDLHIAMKYPLDYRRYRYRHVNLQSEEKNPRFFSSLQSAYDHSTALQKNGETIIIKAKYLSPPKNQGDYYPLTRHHLPIHLYRMHFLLHECVRLHQSITAPDFITTFRIE